MSEEHYVLTADRRTHPGTEIVEGERFVTRNRRFLTGDELQRGEIAGLFGDNGSGATTFLKLAQRKVQPDTGTVSRERWLDIGYVEQTPAFTPFLTLS